MVKRIGILGGGESGYGVALLAAKNGFDVWLSEMGNIVPSRKQKLKSLEIPFEEGQNSIEKLLSCDFIVKSPGIPTSAPLITRLKDKGLEVIGELDFACQFTSATLVGITGSNGKTTTASLLYHILKKERTDVGLAGNIGRSFSRALVEDPEYSTYVLEVSSFQLDDSPDFAPHISILTNITPDHLDRYDNVFSQYSDSKMQICKNQSAEDWFIHCSDDPESRRQLEKTQIKAQCLGITYTCDESKTAFVKNENLQINLKKKHSLCQSMN